MVALLMAAVVNSQGPPDCCCNANTARANGNYCNDNNYPNYCSGDVCDRDNVAFDYFGDRPTGPRDCPTDCIDYCSGVPAGAVRDGCITCCDFCCSPIVD